MLKLLCRGWRPWRTKRKRNRCVWYRGNKCWVAVLPQNMYTIPWLRFFYPDWGFTTLTEVFLPWLRFFYPDWGFTTLTEVFLPWLRFYYPDWGFSTLTEVFLHWLRFYYPDWGFSTLTEVFPCFFLSCKANAGVKLTSRGTIRTLQK